MEIPPSPPSLPPPLLRTLSRQRAMKDLIANATPKTALSILRSSNSVSVRPTTVVLEVSPFTFRCLWTIILVVRCVSAFHLAATSALYVFLAHPNMVYYASLLGPDAKPQLVPMGVCLAVLASAHGYKAARMIYHSWSCGELVYENGDGDKYGSMAALPVDKGRTTEQDERNSQSGYWHSICRVCTSLWISTGSGHAWRVLFGRRGFFGVKSEYFGIRLTVRELSEILSQTLQLRKASQLIARHWITNLYACIVVVNCWSTPVVQHFCRCKVVVLKQRGRRRAVAVLDGSPTPQKQQSFGADQAECQLQGVLALERLLCVSIDVVLDMCTSIAIPAVILWPYVPQFNLEQFNFESTILYDDVRFVSLVNELQQVFAVNLVDAIVAFFPLWGIYTGCSSMKSLVARSRLPSRRRTRVHVSGARGSPSVGALPLLKLRGAGVCARDPDTTPKPPPSTWIRASRSRIVDHARNFSKSNPVHVLFFLWGLVVLGLHTHAITRTTNPGPGCKQVLRPWLTSQTACSVFEFNCYMNQSTSVNEQTFEDLDKSSLAALIVSHCSALVVPSSIRDFPNLVGFEIYNSTIVQWNKTASFSLTDQRRLAYIQILRTNMTQFPEGLTTTLPPNLMDIEVSISNLSTLPDDLHVYWPPMAIVYFEYCTLTSFPVVLSRIQIADLSLVGNPITTLATSGIDDWSCVQFGTVGLGYTPLHQLPSVPIGSVEMLRSVTVEGTKLKILPEWMIETADARRVKVYLKNSVFCLDQSEDIVMEEFGAGAYLTCVDQDPRGNGSVPIDFISSHRSLVRGGLPSHEVSKA